MNDGTRPRLTSDSEPFFMAISSSPKCDERVDRAMDFTRRLRIHEKLTMTIKDNI
jgi:hypothetical protein